MRGLITKEKILLWLAKQSFSDKERLRVWRKLSAQIGYNFSLLQSLQILRNRALARRSPLASMYDVIITRMHEGKALGEALDGFIPPSESLLISSGQHTASLDQSLSLCCELIEAQIKIKNSIVSALAYPALLFSMFCALLAAVSFYVLPSIGEIVDPDSLEGAARTFFAVAAFVASPVGMSLFVLFVVGVLCALAALPYWTGNYRLKVEACPPFSFYRLVIGSVWLYTVATLMRSGMQLNHVLEAQIRNPNLQPYLRERVEAVRQEVAMGKGFGQSLADTGMSFPDAELVDDLCVYSALPKFHEHMQTMAHEWLQEGTNIISRQSHILNAILILFITVLLAGVALSIGSLQQQLSTSTGVF